MTDIFAGYSPENPLIMSAAGLCKTFDLNAIDQLAAAADKVVVGSITLDKRAGNEGICEYFDNELYSVNAWGMPNPGRHVPIYSPGTLEGDQHARLRDQIIVSLAEFSPDGYYELFRALWQWGIAVELNFGCPNIRDDGTQHKIVSFDPSALADNLGLLRTLEFPVSVGVKLSPYSDPGMLNEVASVITEAWHYRMGYFVRYVALTNTFANGRAYTKLHKPALNTKQGGVLGGIGGEALKPISLANAAQFREVLPDEIAVIRVGGVSTGEDVWQSYDVGCAGVQIATAVAVKGVDVFTAIRQEYADIVG